MSARARKILGLVVENKTLGVQNTLPEYNPTKKQSYENRKDSNHEITQIENIRPNKGLVPYYDTDSTLSDNDEKSKQRATTETLSKNEEHQTQTSSSFSTSSSSSSSSESSSSSDSDSSQSTSQVNPRPLITRHVTIDQTDSADVIENTPPQKQFRESYREDLNRYPRANKKTQNYYTSPIHTDESDIDLSDTDPTFLSTEPKRKRNYFFYQSSSSSSSSLNSRRLALNKGRKRTKNSSQWKQNKIKGRRNKGKPYVSSSKSKKSVPARCLKEPCTEKCRLKCTTKIDLHHRYELFSMFWDLGDLEKQKCAENIHK